MADETLEGNEQQEGQENLAGGSYEIIQRRLLKLGDDLNEKIDKLNTARKDVYGALDTRFIGQDRILTNNNCIARDMIPIGNRLLFGYQVYMGLKQTVKVSDIFSLYAFKNNSFEQIENDFLDDSDFARDIQALYSYFKTARFATFSINDVRLLMIFQIGNETSDIRAFKWDIKPDGSLNYSSSRAEHEVVIPLQHDFEWKETTREQQVYGLHPHVTIEDRIFVECVGGDFTIKIEDNTDDGAGVYREDVEYSEQTLDDAEISYAILEHLILLKVKPYREKDYRYYIYNEKTETAIRADDIEECAINLPESDGLIFPRGFYLENGDYKHFDLQTSQMRFRRMFPSSNGEDYLYIFYSDEAGEYIIMQYNIIEKKIENPIHCHGFAVYEDGKLIFFKSDNEQKKSHAIQIWQTPFVKEQDSFIQKDNAITRIGNKDLVQGIAELRSVHNLIKTEKIYLGLYHRIVRRTTKTLDLYHWLSDNEIFNPRETLQEVNKTAKSALDEYEKVQQIKGSSENELKTLEIGINDLVNSVGGRSFKAIDEYVDAITKLQLQRGKVISLKDLRYINTEKVTILENLVKENLDRVAINCIDFLLRDTAFKSYYDKIDVLEVNVSESTTVKELQIIEKEINNLNNSLNLLMELVNTLKIDDANKTTKIIDSISNVFTQLNQLKAIQKKHKGEIFGKESEVEFTAQFKLIGQAVSNYIDQADTPERCEELLTRILVQIEELEGKFSEFDKYIEKLTEKREEVYSAFNSKKVQLQEVRNKRAQSLFNSADRILNGITKRTSKLKGINELNAYFAGDQMVAKVYDIIEELVSLGDAVKSEDLASKIKTLQQEGARQLKDKLDLFTGDDNVISFGQHKFLVNQQNVDLTTVMRDNHMFFHITGTEFFEKIENESFGKTVDFWNQELVSETKDIYRSEFLAYKLILDIDQKDDNYKNRILKMAERVLQKEKDNAKEDVTRSSSFTNLRSITQEFMSQFYTEGYEKGLHDVDATKIFASLFPIYEEVGTLRYHPKTRAYGYLFWYHSPKSEEKKRLESKIKSFGIMNKMTRGVYSHDAYIEELRQQITDFFSTFDFHIEEEYLRYTPEYLFEELQVHAEEKTDFFPVNKHAFDIYLEFRHFLQQKGVVRTFNKAIASVGKDLASRLSIVNDWVTGFITKKSWTTDYFLMETVVLVLGETMDNKIEGDLDESLYRDIETACEIKNLLGQHPRIEGSMLRVDISDFILRIDSYMRNMVPQYEDYRKLKHEIIIDQKEDMRLDEFKPKVMSSFVRNKLIDSVYLPLVGANLAKQIGSYGVTKRTDLMGLLLLISPPGYGKTTLMEYLANRLGLIFMKINCPAIGSAVTSLDPEEADNATAREEVYKLNLSLEMGNNVMIYLDDIQHTNPEFLQKFISLCDAQRKIEGVYRGKTRTYDLRGKRVSVVMAGNPYTESGEKFQIPDMLANRADVYNLGDILGGHEDAFNMSYLENCITSNRILVSLASRSQGDVYSMVQVAKRGSAEGVEFSANYSKMEIDEYANIFKKLLFIQEIVLKVNQQYIYSASQDDAFRTEPNFLLQGSYRNMNRMAEKIEPVMNEAELKQMVLDHYIDDSQLLTTGAEFNLLKFKEMMDWITEEENERLEHIRKIYGKNKSLGSIKDNDPMSQIIGQINLFNDRFETFVETISKKK